MAYILFLQMGFEVKVKVKVFNYYGGIIPPIVGTELAKLPKLPI
jgi:hypothetical protein